MESSRDRFGSGGRGNPSAVSYGVVFGIVVGSMAFAITQNPVWVGLGIPFGAALGIAMGAAFDANRS